MLLVAACSPSTRTYEIRAWGEAFVEDRIPASEVVGGWEIEFDELVIAVGELSVQGDDRVDLEGWYVLDLTEPTDGAGQPLTEVEVTGRMTTVGYRLGRVRGDIVGGNASPAQVDALTRGGHGLRVRGRAQRGDEEIAFAWDFPMDYGHTCELGQAIATPQPGGPTLTIHADHLLLDDLEHDPRVAFDTIAGADADGDGVVVSSELSMVDITVLERYQSGSAEIPDLWSYIGRLAGTLGHVDGEGGCTPVFVPRDYVGLASPGDHGAGEDVYATHCASCHGPTGAGDGPSATGWPSPTNLTQLVPAALDPDYLLYRIREGGGFFPYDSTMAAYDGVLSDGEEQALLGHILSWNHGSGH